MPPDLEKPTSSTEDTSDFVDLLPVSHALEVIYCPRNFYYRYVQGIQDQNAAMARGSVEERRRQARETVYRPESVHYRDVNVFSHQLGLIGIIDAVEETDEGPVPLEYKSGEADENPYDRAQLCAYGMMLESMRDVPIGHGFLYYTGSRKRVRIDFTADLRQRVISAVEQALDILKDGEVPSPLDDERCKGCAIADICMPDEVTILSGKADTSPTGVAPRSTFERTVFLDESWGSLGRRENRMVIKQGGDVLQEIPFELFDQVFVIGNMNLSGAIMHEFFRRNVFVAFFSTFGRYEGCLTPEKMKYAKMRMIQVKNAMDPEICLGVAREIVDAKLANMRVILRRAASRGAPDLESAVNRIAVLRKEIFAAKDPGFLMGIEGAGSRAYFDGYKTLFDTSWGFRKRTRRPPRDPVNAALSFAYSILAGQITGIIQAVGMDAYIGFFHRERYNRPCLALDLIEVFRPVIADSVVLRLFSTQMVTPKDFDVPDPDRAGCYLNESGREAFFRAFSARMQEQAIHPVFQTRLTYRRLIEMEVRFLAKFLSGEIPRFQPYRIR